jgi:hypothetical protein
MLRRLIKFYLVGTTAAAVLWGALMVWMWLGVNRQGEACADIYDRSVSAYSSTEGSYADYADGGDACLLSWPDGMVLFLGWIAVGLALQAPAYAYVMLSNRRRRSGAVHLDLSLPDVARTYIGLMALLAMIWFGYEWRELATNGVYLPHCDALGEDGSGRDLCRVQSGPVLFHFAFGLAGTVAVLQSPAWAYLYYRRRKRRADNGMAATA